MASLGYCVRFSRPALRSLNCLSHPRHGAAYNRSRYRQQVAAALQRLADALDGIESGAAKVVALRVGV